MRSALPLSPRLSWEPLALAAGCLALLTLVAREAAAAGRERLAEAVTRTIQSI